MCAAIAGALLAESRGTFGASVFKAKYTALESGDRNQAKLAVPVAGQLIWLSTWYGNMLAAGDLSRPLNDKGG